MNRTSTHQAIQSLRSISPHILAQRGRPEPTVQLLNKIEIGRFCT